VAAQYTTWNQTENLKEKTTKNIPMSMTSPVQSNNPGYQKSIKVVRICWKGWFFSLEWKSEGV